MTTHTIHAKTLAKLIFMSVMLSASVGAENSERIANEGTIGNKWALADGVKLASAEYPAHMASRGDNVCIALSYLINPNGSTSDFSVVKQWNSESGENEPAAGFWQAFAQAGADAVAQWKFKPKAGVGAAVPTRTVATLGFTGNEGVDPAQLRSHCKVTDLATQLTTRPRRNDNVNQQLDRDRQTQQERLIQEQLQRANSGRSGG